MVQLSLLDQEPLSLEALLSQLSGEWQTKLGAGVPTADASRVVLAHFREWEGRPLTAGQSRRVSAYFGGVMRRRLTRPGDPSVEAARRLLIRASVEADLREAGWSRERATAEALRVCGLEPALGGVA